jgi:hypothetical protein
MARNWMARNWLALTQNADPQSPRALIPHLNEVALDFPELKGLCKAKLARDNAASRGRIENEIDQLIIP